MEDDLLGLTQDDARLYVAASKSGAIKAVDKSTGTPTILTSVPSPLGIAVDATAVYFTTSAGLVGSVPKIGGAFTPLDQVTPAPGCVLFDVVVTGTQLFYSNSCSLEIRELPKTGGSATVFAKAASSPFGLATDAFYLYWREGDMTSTGRVMRKPLGGGAEETLASGQPWARGLVLSDTQVFWSVGYVTGGLIMSARKDGSELTVLARDQLNPHSLALNPNWLAWTDYGGATVMRLAR